VLRAQQQSRRDGEGSGVKANLWSFSTGVGMLLKDHHKNGEVSELFAERDCFQNGCVLMPPRYR